MNRGAARIGVQPTEAELSRFDGDPSNRGRVPLLRSDLITVPNGLFERMIVHKLYVVQHFESLKDRMERNVVHCTTKSGDVRAESPV